MDSHDIRTSLCQGQCCLINITTAVNSYLCTNDRCANEAVHLEGGQLDALFQ